MWRYLKAAFLVGVDVPGLGRLPVNALGAAAFGIVGFAEPALWLIGAGLETALLFALTTSARFRNVVDAAQLQSSEQDAEAKRRDLVRTLPPELQRRLLELDRNCQRVTDVSHQADSFVAETNRDALQRLEWVYLKLLVARHNLTSMDASEPPGELARRIHDLESGIPPPGSSESLRQSKLATVAIMKERLANTQRRKDTIEEIDSDLARIEAQVQLLLENIAIQGKPATITTDIELASNLGSSLLYGDSGGAIADLDQTFSKTGLKERE